MQLYPVDYSALEIRKASRPLLINYQALIAPFSSFLFYTKEKKNPAPAFITDAMTVKVGRPYHSLGILHV